MYHEYRRGPDGKRRKFYCVQWPKVGQGRHRQYFKDFREARRLRDQKLEERGKYGVAHLAITDRQRVEYVTCIDMLRPLGRALTDAVEHYVAHLKASEKSCTAAQLVEEILTKKESDRAKAEAQGKRIKGLSKRHTDDLRTQLRKFADKFDGQPVATITKDEINGWLRSLNVGPVTQNKYRRLVIYLFNVAMQCGYAQSNPATGTSKEDEPDGEVGILTVDQARSLLKSASPEILPYIAIGLFAGLRRSEIERLDYSALDFNDGLIEVDKQKVKGKAKRFVPMQPNLREWLSPYRQHKGSVIPKNFRKQFDQAREAAGITEWPDNAPRHSHASYHLAHFNDMNALAVQMGNSPQMIDRHYRRLVRPKDAERFWNIRPITTENIVPLGGYLPVTLPG